MAQDWHYVVGGSSKGPHSTLEVEGLIARGQIGPDTLVWTDTLPVWEPAIQHFTFDPGGVSQVRHQGQHRQGQDGLYEGAPSRRFLEALQVCMAKYVTFSGRASRSEFWFFFLWQVVVGLVLGQVDLVVFGSTSTGPLTAIAALAFFLPALAVACRRLHDVDRSAWWIVWLYLILFTLLSLGGASLANETGALPSDFVALSFGLAGLFYLIYCISVLALLCMRGTPGPNRFG